MRYATADAFRAALDQRLKDHALATGTPLVRLRKTVAFDRLLARLVAVAPTRWVLKGALALDFRLGSGTRTTTDIDLGRLDNEDAAVEDFLAAQALDLGDFFIFDVQRTTGLEPDGDFLAVRYRVQAELGGRRFEQFPIDVAFSDPVSWSPERLLGTDLLAFAGIDRVELPVLPIEQHLAEKLHAYTRSYGRDAGPSTRPKDLVDVLLIARSSALDAAALGAALDETFAARNLQALPDAVPLPPADWSIPYGRLAASLGLPGELDNGHRAAAAFFDPILAGDAAGTWEPDAQAWRPPAKPTGKPARLLPPNPDQITIGPLQNVASEIQPIRVRTIFVAITNAGDAPATIRRVEAHSSAHSTLTARAPHTVEPGAAGALELTLAAPVVQHIAPGDRFEVRVDYRAAEAEKRWLSFALRYLGHAWTIEPAEDGAT